LTAESPKESPEVSPGSFQIAPTRLGSSTASRDWFKSAIVEMSRQYIMSLHQEGAVMSFFSPSWCRFLSRQSHRTKNARRSIASRPRIRPKDADGIEPAVNELELREMIGSFVADIALAAGGAVAAGLRNYSLGESAWIDFWVAGGSASEPQTRAENGKAKKRRKRG
jgi:hypothetical protein